MNMHLWVPNDIHVMRSDMLVPCQTTVIDEDFTMISFSHRCFQVTFQFVMTIIKVHARCIFVKSRRENLVRNTTEERQTPGKTGRHLSTFTPGSVRIQKCTALNKIPDTVSYCMFFFNEAVLQHYWTSKNNVLINHYKIIRRQMICSV